MIGKLLAFFWLRGRPYLPALIVSALVGALCVLAIYDRAGRAAFPLDDSFIHLQYARRLSEGKFFSYTEGAGYTSGATSFVWPMLLAPFHLIGFRGLALCWVAWFWGTVFHAALATETARLARPLTGPAGAVGAGALCLAFGAFAWFGWSGMETLLLPWALVRTARLTSTWLESDAGTSDRTVSRTALLTMAVVAPLIRPEGALASLIVFVALVIRPTLGEKPTSFANWLRARALAPVALIGPLCIPTMHWLFTGRATSATAQVKWLIQNPYYDGAGLRAAISANAELLVTDILNGGDWSTVFVPEGLVYAIGLGLLATVYAGFRRKRYFRLVMVLTLVAATLIPCTYYTFLWNRVRYVWPFAPAWFVMLACLATELGDFARRFRPRMTFVTPGILGLFVGALAMKLPWSIRDLAQSAYAIDRQQVALGEWARDNLPGDARIGVNDTGAIAYFGDRPTFDVVGLTTPEEARYWVAGAGSRYEHYEDLGAAALPTHYIVYPGWMGVPAVLGEQLHQATVTDQSILGGATKVVYEARYDTLDSGALPRAAPEGLALTDELDVSNLASEMEHLYQVGSTSAENNRAVLSESTQGDGLVSDGGRFGRIVDVFQLRLTPGKPATLVMRLSADAPTDIQVTVGGVEITKSAIPWSDWSEISVVIPAENVMASTDVRIGCINPETSFGALHYWAYQPE